MNIDIEDYYDMKERQQDELDKLKRQMWELEYSLEIAETEKEKEDIQSDIDILNYDIEGAEHALSLLGDSYGEYQNMCMEAMMEEYEDARRCE